MSASPLEQFPGYDADLAFDEPMVFDGRSFNDLLAHATLVGASDITAQTEEPVYAYISGKNVRLTKRILTANEIELISNSLYGSQAVSMIRSGQDIDCRHSVAKFVANAAGSMVPAARMGFRVNMTGCWARGSENGIQITARTIKSLPPSVEELKLEDGLAEEFNHEHGLVCVCGPTGSGKSTLLAAVMRGIIEKADSNKKIITLEAPIEYTYDEVDRASAIVSQHEIPRHIKSFSDGVRNTLRRAPKIILVGETRDRQTVEASLEASQTGHVVYTTVHSNTVANTISRMANMFPPSERMTKVFELAESLRLIVVQRLVMRADGKGRVALREFLSFDQGVRDRLRVVTSLREVEHVVGKLVETKGQSMLTAAQRAYDAGLISIDIMNIFERESRSSLIDDLGLDS